jgi:hypothetical protein
MMKAHCFCHFVCLILGFGTVLTAYSKEPEELIQLRKQYERKANLAAAELKRYYSAKLEVLEAQLAAAADYAQAKAVRAERNSLHSISHSEHSVVPLSLEEAQVIALKEQAGTLTDWKSNSTVEWSALRLAEGDYRVELELSALQSASELPDGELMLEEVTELNDADQNRIVFKLKDLPRATSTATPTKLSSSIALELRRMPVTLRLSVSKAIKTQEITLHAVDLVLQSKPQAEDSANLSTELMALLKQHEEQHQQLQQKHSKLYQDELQQLAKQAQSGLEAQIQEEIERLEQSLASAKQTKAKLGINSSMLGLEQFIELEGARWVKDPANRGDLFKIEHAGKTQWVRLAFIVCPPLEPTPSHAMKQTVEKFRISPTEAVSLGVSAVEFTEFQLQDQPLTLLLRNREKSKEADPSASSALVFVPGAGLLQNLLIDVGLAVVDDMPVRMNSLLKQALEQREQSVKNSPTPLGGWAWSQKAK